MTTPATTGLRTLLTFPCDCSPDYTERGRHAPDCRYQFIHDYLDDDEIAAVLEALATDTVVERNDSPHRHRYSLVPVWEKDGSDVESWWWCTDHPAGEWVKIEADPDAHVSIPGWGEAFFDEVPRATTPVAVVSSGLPSIEAITDAMADMGAAVIGRGASESYRRAAATGLHEALGRATTPGWRSAARRLHASGDDEPYVSDTPVAVVSSDEGLRAALESNQMGPDVWLAILDKRVEQVSPGFREAEREWVARVRAALAHNADTATPEPGLLREALDTLGSFLAALPEHDGRRARAAYATLRAALTETVE